jgi:cytochrome c-type biogenesis protein CcmF
VGPLFAWRRTSLESLRRNFQWPALAALLCSITLAAAGMRHLYALVCFSLCAFVTLTIMMEFYRGGRVIQRKHALSLPAALLELTRRNTRRYGGYLVHMAIVLMFVGFAGAAFNQVHQEEMEVGDSIEFGNYAFKLQNVSEMDNPNYFRAVAAIDVTKNGEFLDTLMPERRFYHASNQPTSRVDVRNRLREDVYVVYAGQSNDGANPVIQVYINPLVNWIWIGALVLIFGTLVALVPSKSPRRVVRAQSLDPAGMREPPVAPTRA